MGYFLVFESMLETVIYAREKYLKPVFFSPCLSLPGKISLNNQNSVYLSLKIKGRINTAQKGSTLLGSFLLWRAWTRSNRFLDKGCKRSLWCWYVPSCVSVPPFNFLILKKQNKTKQNKKNKTKKKKRTKQKKKNKKSKSKRKRKCKTSKYETNIRTTAINKTFSTAACHWWSDHRPYSPGICIGRTV